MTFLRRPRCAAAGAEGAAGCGRASFESAMRPVYRKTKGSVRANGAASAHGAWERASKGGIPDLFYANSLLA